MTPDKTCGGFDGDVQVTGDKLRGRRGGQSCRSSRRDDLLVLAYFSDDETLAVYDIAERSGLWPGTVKSIVENLVKVCCLDEVPPGIYRLSGHEELSAWASTAKCSGV